MHVNDPAVHVRVQWTMVREREREREREKKREKKKAKKKKKSKKKKKACTKSVRAFRVLTLHTTRKKKKKNESKKLHQEHADTMAATPLDAAARMELVLFEFLHPVNQDGYVTAIAASRRSQRKFTQPT